MVLKIPFVKPSLTQVEYDAVLIALKEGAIGGNGRIGLQTQQWLADYLRVKHALLTTSCSHALEMAMMALNIGPGDEVILPSFAFVTAASAIVRQGARPVFAEIDETTFNIAPQDVKQRITSRSKAIVVVHYAGLGCKMAEILSIAQTHHLFVVEDAAQAIGASYMGQPLGTQGHIGCYSFHSTKNVVAGEGGAFVTNDEDIARKAEIVREKGTNRSQFLRGEVDKYTWVDLGSSYVISDLLAALLYAQLQRVNELTQARQKVWWRYYQQMADLETAGLIIRPGLDPQTEHNGHIYAFRVAGEANEAARRRNALLDYLKSRGVGATFHFIPLHSSPYGQERLGYKEGDFPITERVSASLVRLPLYPELSSEQVDYVLEVLNDGFKHVI
ncbi:MAG: dTDP-4-amino-4,6-dideoxygalactose transaminase [Anaerolineae bacterium]|nr:dTDP-4-amino-4,6-dideoxygalactose transaminase [Anaerolineae bacterium]